MSKKIIFAVDPRNALTGITLTNAGDVKPFATFADTSDGLDAARAALNHYARTKGVTVTRPDGTAIVGTLDELMEGD